MINEIFILNPKEMMTSKIEKNILKNGFEQVESDEINGIWKYQKEHMTIDLVLCEDYIGQYIVIVCNGISNECLRKKMTECPECGGNDLQVSILSSWRNSVTEQLFEEGRLIYGVGAYDRAGTRPETHICLGCGCKWHNSANMNCWNEIISQGRTLTKKDLGFERL